LADENRALSAIGEERKLAVFISYARADESFADQLVAALESRGLDVIIDKRNLPAVEDWKCELLGFIRQVDSAVFVLSPSSLASRVCQWEVDQVKALSKRLAPVDVVEAVPLARRQMTDFGERFNPRRIVGLVVVPLGRVTRHRSGLFS
jgi:TIR domain